MAAFGTITGIADEQLFLTTIDHFGWRNLRLTAPEMPRQFTGFGGVGFEW